MQASQDQIAEMVRHMQVQCQFFQASVQYNPKDDQSYAAWGSMLMHLSMVSEQQDQKKEYLTQSIEKLEMAISLNEESRTHEGELAYFALGNALYFAFFLEKNDAVADAWLGKAKVKFEVAKNREPQNPMYEQMIEQLATAHEQRKAAHDHLQRLEGKSEEEKKAEIRIMQMQMLESVVENNKKQVAKDEANPSALAELAKAQFELAMLYERAKATALLTEALEVVKKSLDIKLDGASLWVRAVLLQALGFAAKDAVDAKRQQGEAKRVFDQVLAMENDVARRDALQKELEMLNSTMRAWSDWMAEAEGTPSTARPVGTIDSGAVAGAGAQGKSKEAEAAVPVKRTVVSPGNEDPTGFYILAGMVVVGVGVIWYISQRKSN